MGLGAREPALGGPLGGVALGLAAHGRVEAQVGVAPAVALGADPHGDAPGAREPAVARDRVLPGLEPVEVPGDHLPVGPGVGPRPREDGHPRAHQRVGARVRVVPGVEDGEPGVHAHRPELGDGAGDRAHVDHVAGDVAEEEGQARVAPRDAGEADLLAGLAVVVAGGRDGRVAGVGRPRGVDGDAVGARAVSGSAWPHASAQAVSPPGRRREPGGNASPNGTASVGRAARARTRPSPGRRGTGPWPCSGTPRAPCPRPGPGTRGPPS